MTGAGRQGGAATGARNICCQGRRPPKTAGLRPGGSDAMTVGQASGEGTTAGRIKSLKDGYGVVLDSTLPLPLVRQLGPRPHGRVQVRAWLRDKRREEDVNALISSLNWCSGSRAPFAADSVPTPRQYLVKARVRELVDRSLPTFAIPGQRVAFLKLLRGRDVYDTRDGGLSLASFRSVLKISMPTTTAGSLRVETAVTGETRQYLENGMERMLRSRQEISEMKERLGIIPKMDKTLASNRRRYLQLVRALLKRDMVTLIDVDEVLEHAGVFLVEKPGQDTQRLIIDARASNVHFLLPLGVSLVTSEGL